MQTKEHEMGENCERLVKTELKLIWDTHMHMKNEQR